MKPSLGPLPPLACGTCTACCWEPPFLDDGEQTPHKTREAFNPMMQVFQKRLLAAPSGTCEHLTPTGCGVYESRPNVCKRFDCREWFRAHNRNDRKRKCKNERAVFAAGKERGA